MPQQPTWLGGNELERLRESEADNARLRRELEALKRANGRPHR